MATYYTEKGKLEGEYRQAFERAKTYSMLKGIDADADEDMMMNLVDILYTAQVEGKPVCKIIGDDVEKFCKDYFEEYLKNNKENLESTVKRIFSWFYSICWLIMILCLLEIVFPEKKVELTEAYIDISGVVFGSIVGFIFGSLIVYILQSIIFKVKKINAIAVAFIYLSVLVLLTTVSVLLCMKRDIKIPLLYTAIVTGVYIIVYKSVQLYSRKKKTGSIKKAKKQSSFKEILSEGWNEGLREIPLEFKSKWEKKNKKLRKKAKPEITPQEFTDKIKKQVKNDVIIIGSTYSIIYIVFIIIVSLDSTVEDTIIFGIILGLVYAVLCKIFLFGAIRKARVDIIRKCDEEGITIIELADRIEQEKTGVEEKDKKIDNKS